MHSVSLPNLIDRPLRPDRIQSDLGLVRRRVALALDFTHLSLFLSVLWELKLLS